MQITACRTHLMKLPLARPITPGTKGTTRPTLDSVFVLVVDLETDAGQRGLGYAWSVQGGGRAMKLIVDDDLAPAIIGEDPLDHERMWLKLYWHVQSIGRRGLVMQAQSAIDLAVWDLKGKAAGMPVWKLLGGARSSAAVYWSDGGWLWMSVDEILRDAEERLAQGMHGIKLKVGQPDPRVDLQRVRAVRKALGDDAWIAVDANQKWDFDTALRMGREFEELRLAWFEEPLSCEDVDGHARLADALDIPIALGETLQSRHEFVPYLRADAVDIVQPDLTRVGGLTEFLKIAALAEAAHRPVAPHLMMEASVHLACGLPGVTLIEYMPWLTSVFTEPLRLDRGRMLPPSSPGLGLEPSADVLRRYEVV